MRLPITGWLFFFHSIAFAQDHWTEAMLVPDKAIRLSPLHALNFYPTLELSYEQARAQRFTTLIELGFVLDYPAEDAAFRNKRGMKFKLEGRYYFNPRPDRKRSHYAALEPYLNVINFDRTRTDFECFDVECSHRYWRRYDYKMEYREKGVSVKAGLIRYLGMRLFLDINAGLSLRHIRYDSRGLSPPADEGWNFFEIPDEADRVVLGPNMGLRLGYRLK